MKYPKVLTYALKKLKTDGINPTQSLLFLDAPSEHSMTRILQALHLHKITTISNNNFGICPELSVYFSCQIHEIKKLFTVTRSHNFITFTSLNTDKFYFRLKNLNESAPKTNAYQHSIKTIIQKQDINGNIERLSLFFDENFLASNPQIILWLYNNATFLVI